MFQCADRLFCGRECGVQNDSWVRESVSGQEVSESKVNQGVTHNPVKSEPGNRPKLWPDPLLNWTSLQASKLVWNSGPVTDPPMGVKCEATSVAKNCCLERKNVAEGKV